jgi:hypothetical protein
MHVYINYAIKRESIESNREIWVIVSELIISRPNISLDEPIDYNENFKLNLRFLKYSIINSQITQS